MEIQKLKARDIRIGNYVVFNSNDKPFQISAAGLLEISQLEGKPNPYFYEGIKITKDILYLLGFVDDEYFKNTYTYKNFVIYLHDGMYCYDLVNNIKSFTELHDLQNLYYAIYKQELLLPNLI